MGLSESGKEREKVYYSMNIVTILLLWVFLGFNEIFGILMLFWFMRILLCFPAYAYQVVSVYIFIYLRGFNFGGYASGKVKGWFVRKKVMSWIVFTYFEISWFLNQVYI